MRRVMVRYTVKADRVEENVAAVEAVYAELREKKPDGIRYATFRAKDGVSFVHVASVEATDGKNPLLSIDAFKRFTEGVQGRIVEPAVTTEYEVVGAYRLLED